MWKCGIRLHPAPGASPSLRVLIFHTLLVQFLRLLSTALLAAHIRPNSHYRRPFILPFREGGLAACYLVYAGLRCRRRFNDRFRPLVLTGGHGSVVTLASSPVLLCDRG